MPNYLRFVRGVIDSEDLPLNVSREILQHSRDIDAIRAGSTKKVLGLLENLARQDAGKYDTFWKEFGRVLKEGIVEDTNNREQIASLLRFCSTASEGDAEDVSLADYIARMGEGQDKIYYVTAETRAAARHSPHLEIFRKQGVEVLLLSDRVDEWVTAHLPEFDGKPLVSVSKGELDSSDLGEEEDEKSRTEKENQYKDLLDRIGKALEDRVKSVRLSHRLTESPACLVADTADLGSNLERILREAGQEVGASMKILEINPDHPLVQRLATQKDDARFADWSNILYDQARLAEGSQLDDPAAFVQRLNGVLLELTAQA
jgi:molecular chaperone HtpG